MSPISGSFVFFWNPPTPLLLIFSSFLLSFSFKLPVLAAAPDSLPIFPHAIFYGNYYFYPFLGLYISIRNLFYFIKKLLHPLREAVLYLIYTIFVFLIFSCLSVVFLQLLVSYLFYILHILFSLKSPVLAAAPDKQLLSHNTFSNVLCCILSHALSLHPTYYIPYYSNL